MATPPQTTEAGARSAAYPVPVAPSVAEAQTLQETFGGAAANSAHSRALPESSPALSPFSAAQLDQTLLPDSMSAFRGPQDKTERLPAHDGSAKSAPAVPLTPSDSATLPDQTLPPPPSTGSVARMPHSSAGSQAVSHEGSETLITEQNMMAGAPTGPIPGVRGDFAQPTKSPVQQPSTQDAERTAAAVLADSAAAKAPLSQGKRTSGAQPISAIEGYDILGVLGRGGMGIVYKARDARLDRIVALKMILSAAHVSKTERDRFESEARAVAQLKHANILQIYNIGKHDGQPYFSLEYLEGGTLQERLEKYSMPPREAAQLIEVLARALHYAHQKGILHRDIKPANVLLTSDHIPKISDFGLAKRLDPQGANHANDGVVGTPMYMSPEQANGKADIGPPADIYSLGATLYEMIAGKPPFRGSTVLDTLRMVKNDEPVAPRHLQPSVPRDLQTICLKCLHKDPKQRYQTAEAFANDLRNYLDGKPIAARSVPAWEKAWKWSRRNPAAALLIAVSCVSLLGFAIGGVGFAIAENHRAGVEAGLREEAENQENIAKQQRTVAEQQRDLAKKRGQEAIENFQSAQAAVEVLVRLARNRMTNERHLESVGKELLEKALEFYDGFLLKEPNDPLMRGQMARAQLLAGDLREKLGQYGKAQQAYAKAEKLYRDLQRDFPGQTMDHDRDLAAVYINWSTVLQFLKDDQKADETFAKAQGLLGKISKQKLRDPITVWLMGGGCNNRGLALHLRMELDQAEQAYQQAIALFSEVAANSTDPIYAVELANSKINLAYLWTVPSPGQPAKAEPLYQQAIAELTPVIKLHADVPAYRKSYGMAYLDRGILFTNMNRYEEADQDFSRAGDIFQELTRDYAGVSDYHYLTALVQLNLSTLRMRQKKWAEGITASQLAVSRLQKLVAAEPGIMDYHFNLALSTKNLANILDEQLRNTIDVLPFLGASTIGLAAAPWGNGSLLAATSLVPDRLLITTNAVGLAQMDQTERCWYLALDRWMKLNKEHGNLMIAQQLALTYQGIVGFHKLAASKLLAMKRTEDAEAHLQRLILASKKTLGKEQTGQSLLTLAQLRLVLGKHAAAAQSIAELNTLVPAKSALNVWGAGVLAQCLDRADKTLQGPERDKTVKEYGNRAMAMLKAAVEDGFADAKFPQAVFLRPLALRPEYRTQFEKLKKSIVGD